MYEYVPKSHVKPYRLICQDMLSALQAALKKEHKVTFQYQLIGSGAENLVMRNGNGGYDLDYNVMLKKVPAAYYEAPGRLKEIIRVTMDGIVTPPFSKGKDSTSSITYLVHSQSGTGVAFAMDLAILIERDGRILRLIHDKEGNRYIWNPLCDQEKIRQRAELIRKTGQSAALRDTYLRLRNYYLQAQDTTHPAFVVYTQAVNEVYGQIGVKEDQEMAQAAGQGNKTQVQGQQVTSGSAQGQQAQSSLTQGQQVPNGLAQGQQAQNAQMQNVRVQGVQSQDAQAQYDAGMQEMHRIIKRLNRMSDGDRYLYITGKQSGYYGSGFSIGDCISKYSIEELRQSVDRYLTDNLEIGDIFIRNEDGLEYLVAKYEDKTPAHKIYRCVSLQDDKEFTLHSITEIQRTDKHINISRLRGYLW